MFKSIGILRVIPSAAVPGHWWMYVKCCEELGRYYRRMCVQFDCNFRGLMKPKEGAHITIMRQEAADDSVLSYDGLEIEFEYEHRPETNGKHVWLPVVCSELSTMRSRVSLSPDPAWPYHLTIGVMPG